MKRIVLFLCIIFFIASIICMDNSQKIFFEAVQNGDFAKIKNLIGKVDMNAQNAEGNTALNIAISTKNLEMVKLLIEKGADVNQQTKHEYAPSKFRIDTPLLNAVENSTPQIVEYLLQKGANPNVTNEMDESPIYLAYENFDLENIKSLVKYGAYINYQVHTPLRAGANDITILMKAAASGKVDRVKELLALGANPFLKNSEGKSAIALVSDKQNAYQGDVSPAGLAKKRDLREIYQLLKSAYEASLLSSVKALEKSLQALIVILQKSASKEAV